MTAPDQPITPLLPLIDRQLLLASELEGILQAEYHALLGSDLATLTELIGRKRATADSLEQASQAVVQSTGGQPEATIRHIGGEALRHWQRLGDAADGLRKQNLLNGALLNERQNRLRWISQRAGADSPQLYAPRPAAFGAGLGGRSLARA